MRPELRVGHLVARYLPATENWIHSLITSLPDATSLVLNRGARENTDRFPVTQVSVAGLSPRAARAEAAGLEQDGISPTLLAAAREFRCGVLHAHFGTEGALGLPLATRLGIPLVTSFYGFDASSLPRDPDWRGPLADLFAAGTLFCAEGPALAARLVALGAPAARIRIVSLPVPLGAPRRPEHQGPPLILVCARLVDKKGVDDALLALAHLTGHGHVPFECIVAGDGPERPALERLAASLGLAGRVTFAGALAPEDVRSLLSRTSILLQMSRTAADGDTEGGAPVILSEAMAHGIPCVATRHADIPYVVLDETTGILVEERDSEAAGDALGRLLADPSRRRSMGDLGALRARERFSAATCGEALRRAYDDARAFGAPERRRPNRVAPASIAAAIEIRVRAADVEGLERLLRRSSLGTAQRSQLLIASASLVSATHPAAAACYLRRARRLANADPGTALAEARAWIAARKAEQAVAPLRAFLRSHPDRAYAWSTVQSVTMTEAHAPALLVRLAATAGTPAERFAARVAACPPAWTRARVAAGGIALLKAVTPAEDRRVVEEALAVLVQGRPEDALAVLDAGLTSPLARYRVASTLESGTPAAQAAARRAFVTVARSDAPLDLRAGAAYHLARNAACAGDTAVGMRWARRCLRLVPTHRAAAALLHKTHLRAAS